MNKNKTFFLYIILSCALISIFILGGCGKDSSSSQSNAGISSSNTKESKDKIIKDLEDANSKLKAQIERNSSEIEQIRLERDQSQENAKSANRKFNFLLYGILFVIIALVVGLIILVRKNRTDSSHSPHDDLCCPRCGWKHGPDETICKNPNCKTRF